MQSTVRGIRGLFICANPACKSEFAARLADRARGWARFCNKSCAASSRSRSTSAYAIERKAVKPEARPAKRNNMWDEDLTPEEWASFRRSMTNTPKDRLTK